MTKQKKPARLYYRLEHRRQNGTVDASEARQWPDLTEIMRVTEIWARSGKPGDVLTWYANDHDAVVGWRACMAFEIKACPGGAMLLYPLAIGRAR